MAISLKPTPNDAEDIVLMASQLLQKKNEDYASNQRGKNFIEAAKVASVITQKTIHPKDVAACLIGIKLSRYGNLTTEENKIPNFEALEDTIHDAINYLGLMEELRQFGIDKDLSNA